MPREQHNLLQINRLLLNSKQPSKRHNNRHNNRLNSRVRLIWLLLTKKFRMQSIQLTNCLAAQGLRRIVLLHSSWR